MSCRVRAQEHDGGADWSSWESADTYFEADPLLGERAYNGTIRAALGDLAWNQSYRGTNNSFNNLPRYVKDGTDVMYALEYRVVETDVKVYRAGANDPILTQIYNAPLDNGSSPYAYMVRGDTTLFIPYYGTGRDTQANNTTTHKTR